MFLFISFQSLTTTSAGGTGRIAYSTAQNLFKKNYPVKLVVSSKGKFNTDFISVPVSWFSKYYLFILNKFIAPFLKPYHKRNLEEKIFDFFCCQHVKSKQKLLFTTTPFIPRTLRKARKLGIPILFFSGTPEETYIAERVKEELIRWNVSGNDVYTYSPRLKIYTSSIALIDHILCHSSIIESTFRKQWPGKKLISCWGLLKPETKHTASVSTVTDKFTVVYAAHTVLLKGLHYLLKAWSQLSIDGELIVIGGIDPAVQKLIAREFPTLEKVKFLGNVTGINKFLESATVLVCPSIIDGGPVTVLEAMNCGVPVILTEGCGAVDFVENGVTGWIVPVAHATSLHDKILWCYHHRDEALEMGKRGQKKMNAYDLSMFIEKVSTETLAIQR